MNNLIVIPARLESTRLPRKLLLAETGKPLIQHTYEAAVRSQAAEEVVVAVDSREMADAVNQFGGRWVMTSAEHVSGTDRVAEVNREIGARYVVNVQGDEPGIAADSIDAVFRRLWESPEADVATLATAIFSKDKLHDPGCVKVVFDRFGKALYFSRSMIPYARAWDDELLEQRHFFQHIGLYGYRQEFLERLNELPTAEIEKLESLEQLRFLYAGCRIFVDVIEEPSIGIDTRADYDEFVKSLDRADGASGGL